MFAEWTKAACVRVKKGSSSLEMSIQQRVLDSSCELYECFVIHVYKSSKILVVQLADQFLAKKG